MSREEEFRNAYREEVEKRIARGRKFLENADPETIERLKKLPGSRPGSQRSGLLGGRKPELKEPRKGL
jgi:hypothetical protein